MKAAHISGFDIVDSDSCSSGSGKDDVDESDHGEGSDDGLLHSFFSECPLDFTVSMSIMQSQSTIFSQSGSSNFFSSGTSSLGIDSLGDDDDDDDDDSGNKQQGSSPKAKKAKRLAVRQGGYSLMAGVSAAVKQYVPKSYGSRHQQQRSLSPVASTGTLGCIAPVPHRDSTVAGVPSVLHDSSVAVARTRVASRRSARAHERQLEHERVLAKQEEAATRRELKSQMTSLVLAEMWRTIITSIRFAKTLKDPRSKRNGDALEVVRRITRNMRLRQLKSMPRPSLAHLQGDKLLALFPEHHLLKFIRRMVPRYYFAGETIMTQNSVEDETFVLCKGVVDVVVSRVVMSTISTPGAVIGSMGMISCEPRTASIIARSNCVFWMGNRFGFDVFSSQTAAAAQFITEQRNANFRKVHQLRLTSTSLLGYRLLHGISPAGLKILCECGEPLIPKGKHAMLLSPTDSLASTSLLLLAGRVTLVLRRAYAQNQEKVSEALAWATDFSRVEKNFLRPIAQRAPPPAPRDSIIHRASVSNEVTESAPPRSSVTFPFQIANLLKFLKFQTDHGLRFANDEGDIKDDDEEGSRDGRQQTGDDDELSEEDDETKDQPGNDDDDDDDDDSFFDDPALDYVPIAEVTAPCLINLAPMMVRKWLGVGAVAKSAGVEALVLRREVVFDALPVDDISRLSENAFKTNYKLIKAPEPAKLPSLFCERQRFASMMQYLQRVCFNALVMKPFAVPEGSLLDFAKNREQRCYIVTKGELAVGGSGGGGVSRASFDIPILWPQLPIIFFGADDIAVKCRSHVEGVTFRRAAFLQLLNRGIREHDKRRACYATMEELYHSLLLQPPKHLFDDSGALDASWSQAKASFHIAASSAAQQLSKGATTAATVRATSPKRSVQQQQQHHPSTNSPSRTPRSLNSSSTVMRLPSTCGSPRPEQQQAESDTSLSLSHSLSFMDDSSSAYRRQPTLELPRFCASSQQPANDEQNQSSPALRSTSLNPAPPVTSPDAGSSNPRRGSSFATAPPTLSLPRSMEIERSEESLLATSGPKHIDLFRPISTSAPPPVASSPTPMGESSNPRRCLVMPEGHPCPQSSLGIGPNSPLRMMSAARTTRRSSDRPPTGDAPASVQGRQSLRSARQVTRPATGRSTSAAVQPVPRHGDSLHHSTALERYLPVLHQLPPRQTVAERRIAAALEAVGSSIGVEPPLVRQAILR